MFDSFTFDKLPHLAQRCFISIVTRAIAVGVKVTDQGMYKLEEAAKRSHYSQATVELKNTAFLIIIVQHEL